jgi:hypothetical protein
VNGVLSWRGNKIRTAWSVRVDRNGRIELSFQPIQLTKRTAWLLKAAPGRGRFVSWATIRGETKDGCRIQSKYVVLNSRAGFERLKIEGEASQLTVLWEQLPKTNVGLRAMYLTVGLQCFQVHRTPSLAGDVYIAGRHDIRNFDELAGQIDVVPTHQRSLRHWLRRCDDTVHQLLEIISLANGKTTNWSIRHVVHDDQTSEKKKIIVTHLYGPKATGRPHDGVGHFLNLKPWIDLAIARYTKRRRMSTGIDVAIQWLLFQPTYLEFRLLAATTALEHLVAKYSKRGRGPKLVDPRSFANIRRGFEPDLTRLLHHARRRGNDNRARNIEHLRNKLRGANQAPFLARLIGMLRFYHVPMDGIDDRIAAAIAARNRIVHTGRYHENGFRELYEHVVVLRELLKRVILTLLKYTGQYHTMLNGSEQRPFPPTGLKFESQPS